MKAKRALISGIVLMRCPKCREEFIFKNRSYFPLNEMVALKKECTICGQKLVAEKNNGAGINYVLTIMIFILNLAWYWPIFGLTYKDNSVYYFLGSSTLVALILQPWLMRFSRVIYLYIFAYFSYDAQQKD